MQSQIEGATCPQGTTEACRQPQNDTQDAAQGVDPEYAEKGDEQGQRASDQGQCLGDQAAAHGQSIPCNAHVYSSTVINNASEKADVQGKHGPEPIKLPRIAECFEIRLMPR